MLDFTELNSLKTVEEKTRYCDTMKAQLKEQENRLLAEAHRQIGIITGQMQMIEAIKDSFSPNSNGKK